MKNFKLLYTFFNKKMPGEFSEGYCFVIKYRFKQNENFVIYF